MELLVLILSNPCPHGVIDISGSKITEESTLAEIKLKPNTTYCSVVIRVKMVYRAQRLVIPKHSRHIFCLCVSLSHRFVGHSNNRKSFEMWLCFY